MPYGQDRFYGVMSDTTSKKQVKTIINSINEIAINFFNVHIIKHDLDAILSVNNYYAGHAALAFYPCLTIPMGYNKKGEPKNLTFITPSFNEKKLLEIGRAYEDISRHRKLPKGYE
jgi:amidase